MTDKKKTVEPYEADQLRRDITELMQLDAFRRYAGHLIAFCGDDRTSFTGNSTTYFNEGARNVALKIKADLVDYALEAYIDMVASNLRKGQ